MLNDPLLVVLGGVAVVAALLSIYWRLRAQSPAPRPQGLSAMTAAPSMPPRVRP